MTSYSRRKFLGHAAAAGVATFTIAGTKSSGKVLGANEAIRVGVAGIRGRGGDHIKEFLQIPGVQVTHLVDPDRRLFAKRVEQIKSKGGNTPKCFKEMLLGLGVKLESTTFRLGRPLKLDPQTEKFIGDPEANRLLTRQYRKPFVVL